jgi:hypothetical protein
LPLTLVGAFLAEHDKFEERSAGALDPTEDEAIPGAELLATMEERGADEPVLESGAIDDDLCTSGVDEAAKEAAVADLASVVSGGEVTVEADHGPAAGADREVLKADADIGVSADDRRHAARVDPPKRTEPVREDEPGLAPAAFPSIFPYGLGDYNAARPFGVPFEVWARHIMLWGDHRAMRHKRFKYWVLKTWLRRRAGQMRCVYYRQHPGDKELTPGMLSTKEAKKALVARLLTVTQDLPGTVGERMGMRNDLERMVDQIETETADTGENGGKGRLPAYFATFTCAVYKWHQLHEMIEKLLPRDIDEGRTSKDRTHW